MKRKYTSLKSKIKTPIYSVFFGVKKALSIEKIEEFKERRFNCLIFFNKKEKIYLGYIEIPEDSYVYKRDMTTLNLYSTIEITYANFGLPWEKNGKKFYIGIFEKDLKTLKENLKSLVKQIESKEILHKALTGKYEEMRYAFAKTLNWNKYLGKIHLIHPSKFPSIEDKKRSKKIK